MTNQDADSQIITQLTQLFGGSRLVRVEVERGPINSFVFVFENLLEGTGRISMQPQIQTTMLGGTVTIKPMLHFVLSPFKEVMP